MHTGRTSRIARGLAVAILATSAVVIGGSATPAQAAPLPPGGITVRVSVSNSGAQANNSSFSPTMSHDGNIIAFMSAATNLVPGEDDVGDEIYVRNVSAKTTQVIETTSGYGPSLSADGLVMAHNSGYVMDDIVVRDLVSGVVTNITPDMGDGGPNLFGPGAPLLSASGRRVVFTSDTKLSTDAADTSGSSDVFFHDLDTGKTTRVTSPAVAGFAKYNAHGPAMSPDARFIVLSVQDQASPTQTTSLLDRVEGTVRHVASGNVWSEAVTADGKFVAIGRPYYESGFADCNKNTVSLVEVATGSTTLVRCGAGDVAFDPSGRYLAYTAAGKLMVLDRTTGVTTQTVGISSSDFQNPVLSSGATFVAFTSSATTLVPGDTNKTGDVFRHERDTTAPNTQLFGTPPNLSNNNRPKYIFAANEPSTFVCSLDNATPSECSSPLTLSPVKDGDHTFSIRAIDQVGNPDPMPIVDTFTVDTAAPTVITLSGPTSPTNDATPLFTFIASEPNVTFQCKMDTGAFGTCSGTSSHVPDPALGTGSHTFWVQAKDAAGNLGAPKSRTFTVDVTPPNVQISGGPNGQTNTATPKFTFYSMNGATSYQCRVDGTDTDYATCTSPETIDPEPDGTHTFYVRGKDAAGNVGPPATRSFLVDDTGPDVFFVSEPAALSNDTTPTFTFSSNDPFATFKCRYMSVAANPPPFAACSGPKTDTRTRGSGTHTFEVRAIDAAGNPSDEPASRTFTIDITAPHATITSPATGVTNVANPPVIFTSPEPNAIFTCRLVGHSGPQNCTSGWRPGITSDGTYTVEVIARDQLGNADPHRATRTFTVDTTAPIAMITRGPQGHTNVASQTFEFKANEPGARFECARDATPFSTFTACTSPTPPITFGSGPHTFSVRAFDAAGNIGPIAVRSFTVDTSAPTTSITDGPTGLTNLQRPTFSFISPSDAHATFECRLDGAAFAGCASPWPIPERTSDGNHRFEVRAVDSAGNRDPQPPGRSFTLDRSAPNTLITSGPGTANPPTFTFVSTQTPATFTCTVDGLEYRGCTSPFSAPGLGGGSHTFSVAATDAAGNKDTTPAATTFTIVTTSPDTTPPQTTVSGPTGLIKDATPTYTFTSELGARFQCRFDTDGFGPCTTPKEPAAALGDGPHTFEVFAVDAAGNADPTPASASFTVDATLPIVTIAPSPAVTNDTTPSFPFTVSEPTTLTECRVGLPAEVNNPYQPCSSPYTTPARADGSHLIDIRAVDLAGNLGLPSTRVITIDTAPPNTAVAGPTGLINDTTPSYTFTSEPGATFQCRFDTQAFAPCTTPKEPASALGDGPHTFDVFAVDALGNADPTPARASFTVDATPPVVTIAPSPAVTNDRTPSFTFTVNEPATTECRTATPATFDTAPFAACQLSYTAATLADGVTFFQVRATDVAGNVGSIHHTFTVDATPPDTTISSGPNGPTNDNTPTFGFSAEAGSTFTCQVDTGPVVPNCASPYTTPTLAPGPHTISILATDAAGNVELVAATRNYTVDTTPTQTYLDTGPSGFTNLVRPTFTFHADDPATFQCRFGSGALPGFGACTTATSYTPSADLEHGKTYVFEVRAIDLAQNIDTSAAATTFTVDLVAPEATITSGVPDPRVPTPSFTFTVDDPTATVMCRLGPSPDWVPCSSPHAPPSIQADGEYTFEVQATDPAGNVDIAAKTFFYDITPPETTITGGVADGGTTNDTTPAFTFISSEPDPQWNFDFQCQLDNSGDWLPCNSGYSTVELTPGVHNFKVRALDRVVNIDLTPASRTFTVVP